MITYKGLPPPVISDHLGREESRGFYEQGTEFHIGKIEMIANTGTYLDTPFHRYADGQDLAGLNLRSLANLEGIVVRSIGGSERAILPAALEHLDVAGKAVLFNTGWDANIVEHLCGLIELPDLGFRFFAVPVKVKRFGSFPVRAFAIVP